MVTPHIAVDQERGWDMARFGVALLASAMVAATPAAAVDLLGLDVSEGPVFSVAQFYANTPIGVGSTFSGYGEVDSINSVAVGSLCAGCELTYRFTDYVVSSISATEIKFSGGAINFYLGFGADNDFTTLNAGGSAGDLAEATNGILFLSLIGHAIDAAGNTLIGVGANIGSASPTGFASGLLDVTGGGASAFFDTNGVPALFGGGNADFQFGSSFTGLFPVYPSECPGGPACVRGSADFVGIGSESGGGEGIPEPATWGMMLLGFLGMGAVMRRRRRAVGPDFSNVS